MNDQKVLLELFLPRREASKKTSGLCSTGIHDEGDQILMLQMDAARDKNGPPLWTRRTSWMESGRYFSVFGYDSHSVWWK